jgi:hypothetical protein
MLQESNLRAEKWRGDETRTRDLLHDRQGFSPTELRPRKLTKNDFPLLPQPCSVLHCLARPST